MLSIHGLTCLVDSKLLFKNLGVTLLPGAILHLTGANGSGKTSLLRMIAGICAPSSNYTPPVSMLYIGHNLGLKKDLSVLENLQFWTKVYESEERLRSAVHYFALEAVLMTKCYRLSAGMQKRVALAKLLACDAKIWLLDEPEVNLDVESRMLLNNLIVSKANTGGIIITTSHAQMTIK